MQSSRLLLFRSLKFTNSFVRQVNIPLYRYINIHHRSRELRQFLDSKKAFPIPLDLLSKFPASSYQSVLYEDFCSKCIKECIQNENYKIALEIFREYHSIYPNFTNSRMLTLLFQIHANYNNADLLNKDIETFNNYFHLFTKDTFVWMIEAFSRCNEYSKAREMFLLMQSEGFDVDIYIYNSLLGCADYKQAKDLIEEMKNSSIELNHDSYVQLIRIYAEEGEFKLLKELFEECMNLKSLKLNSEVLEEFLDAFTEIESEKEKSFVDKIREKIFDAEMLNEDNAACLIRAYGSLGDMGSAKIIFKKTKEEDILCSEIYEAMIDLCCSKHSFEDAVKYLRKLKVDECDEETIVEVYSGIISSCMETHPFIAFELLMEMFAQKLKVDSVLCSDYIYSLCNTPNIALDRIMHVFTVACEFCSTLDAEALLQLHETCLEADRKDYASKVLLYMQENELPLPDKEQYEIINNWTVQQETVTDEEQPTDDDDSGNDSD